MVQNQEIYLTHHKILHHTYKTFHNIFIKLEPSAIFIPSGNKNTQRTVVVPYVPVLRLTVTLPPTSF